MGKKRASLAGRGVEILFGGGEEQGPRPTSILSGSPPPAKEEKTPADRGATAEEAMAAEWEAMLAEEAAASIESPAEELPPLATTPAQPEDTAQPATAAPPIPAEELPPPATTPAQPEDTAQPATAAPPTPAEELPPLATTPAQPEGAVQPPPPAATVPVPRPAPPSPISVEPETPPSPMYKAPETAVEPPAPVPPPKEKPEAVDPIVQAKLMGTLYQTTTVKPTPERLAPEGPETPEVIVDEIAGYERGQPSRVRRETEILAYVGAKQRRALWDEIVELYQVVPDVLCTDPNLPTALQLLQEAQDILLEKPRQFDVALYKVGQVRGILRRRINTSRWSNTYGWGAFAYEVIWIIVLGLAIFLAPAIIARIVDKIGDVQDVDARALLALWNTAAWGGIGGVIAAFYSLYWHVAKKKDFDKQYLMWYIVKPVVGLLVGGLVHLVIGSGFLVARGETASGQETTITLFPYAVACIAGFRQQFILEIIDRIIQLLTPPEPKPQDKPPASDLAGTTPS